MSFNPMSDFKKEKQGFILLISGIVLISVFTIWRYYQVRILSFKVSEYQEQSKEGIIPTYIKMYPLGVDIKIKEAMIIKGVWQVYPDAISHLSSSARVGEKGNIIMYGHNKDNVLGPIRWAKEGATIELYDGSKTKYLYKVVKTDTVEPDNLSYVLPTSEETLTLYTCVGFLDSKRFIVVAKRVAE